MKINRFFRCGISFFYSTDNFSLKPSEKKKNKTHQFTSFLHIFFLVSFQTDIFSCCKMAFGSCRASCENVSKLYSNVSVLLSLLLIIDSLHHHKFTLTKRIVHFNWLLHINELQLHHDLHKQHRRWLVGLFLREHARSRLRCMRIRRLCVFFIRMTRSSWRELARARIAYTYSLVPSNSNP